MMVFTEQAGKLWENNRSGNFSLWFNKYVPIEDIKMEVCSYSGKHKGAIPFYVDQYNKKKNASDKLLEVKIEQQRDFVKSLKDVHVVLEYKIELKTPLIMGMGESHPSENGMTLDHNIGIPYIPSSSIKGALRHVYTVNFIRKQEKNGNLDSFIKKCKNRECLDEIKTEIPAIFGGMVSTKDGKKEETSGSIIVLDAYPLEVPSLQNDIMNNHYTKYYKGEKPPVDTEDPNPVNFISIKPGNEYLFHILVRKTDPDEAEISYIDSIEKAVERMFFDGIGAKTAVGYGRFDWDGYTAETLNRKKDEAEKEIKKRQTAEKQRELEKKAREEQERKEKEERRKEEARKEEQERRRKRELEEKKKMEKMKDDVLEGGIDSFRNAKHFNELKRIKYLIEDHDLNDEELEILKTVIERIYGNETNDRKWKRKNDANWNQLGQWIGGELKNKWFNKITGR